MRMRFCRFGFKYDSTNTFPSGSYLQVANWHGQGAQKAECRDKTLAIMAARLMNHMHLHKTQRNHTNAVHLSIHTRDDKGARTHVQYPKTGPEWDHVVRRVATSLDDNAIIQDIKIQDQPIGHNFNAPLPNGVTSIRTRLYWEQSEPTLLGDGSSRPRSRRAATIDDD
eukprot:4282325-Pyramimonas_sp.AAC.1